MSSPAVDHVRTIMDLPAYEALGLPASPDGLETFDHLTAYRRLGPIYRLTFRGETWVAIGGMDANEAAWRNPDQWDYSDALKPFREMMGPTHVTQLDGEPHRRKRRNLKPGFAHSAIAGLVPAIDQAVADELRTAAGRPLDLFEFFMLALTRANSRSLLRCDYDADTAAAFIRFEERFIFGTTLAEPARRALHAEPGFVRNRARVFEFLVALVARRLGGECSGDNFDAILADRRARGEPLDRDELVPEAYLLLMAGTGNTAKLLNCGLQNLLANSEWLERARTEAAGYAPEKLLGGVGAFPSLRAICLEIERLFPAAPVLARTVADEFVFQGCVMPKGTKVLHMQTLPHFLEEVFEKPYNFDPGRWIGRDYPKKALGSFGGSTHVCLGMNLARLHMPIVLGNVLRDYDIEPAASPRISVNFNYGVPQVADLEAVLRPRDFARSAGVA